MFEVARGIKALDVSFDVILTSPYVRALRTAAAQLLDELVDRTVERSRTALRGLPNGARVTGVPVGAADRVVGIVRSRDHAASVAPARVQNHEEG